MAIEVDCPCCKRRIVFSPENRYRPFCSQRCRQIDLGAWASDQYKIAGNPQEQPPEDSDDAPRGFDAR